MLLFLGCLLLTIPANILLAFLVINEDDENERGFIFLGLGVSVVISCISSGIVYATMIGGLYYTEYWGSFAQNIHHEEPWNEYIHQTCTRTVDDGDGHSHTETYDCSYVQYHSEYWSLTDSIGQHFYIDESYYNELCRKWKLESKTGHNSGYTISGDIFDCPFNGKDVDLVSVNTPHSYYDLPQANGSLLRYEELSKDDQVGLYSKPDKTFDSPSVLGATDNQRLKILNAKYGSQYQIRVYILLFPDKGMEIASRQKQYWKGGAKNELVLCIGTKDGNVTWSNVFSWSESDDLKVELRDEIIKQKKLDIEAIATYLEKEIPNKWKRKEFSDFKTMIHPHPSMTAITISTISSFIVSLIVPVLYVCHKNQHQNF